MSLISRAVAQKYSQLFKVMQESEHIRMQTLLYLFLGYTHYQAKRHYEELFCSQTAKDDCESCRRSDKRSREPLVWDWVEFPRIPKFIVYYQSFSTSWMIYVVLKTSGLLGLLLDQLDPELPSNCYLVGHFRISPSNSGNDIVAFFFCCCHLAWRYTQMFLQRPYKISMALFLMQSERDIERFYTLMDRQQQRRRSMEFDLSLIGHPAQLLDQRTTDERGEVQYYLAERRGNACTCCYRHEASLCEIMCLKIVDDLHGFGVDWTSKSAATIYKLRPNRTRAAYAKLRHNMASTLFSSTTIFVTLALILNTLLGLMLLPDWDYIQLNRGCNKQLEAQFDGGQLGRWSITFTWHRAITFAFDLLENIIIWYDTGCAVVFVLSFDYLINYDLLLYLSHLHETCERLLVEVKLLPLLDEMDRVFATTSTLSLLANVDKNNWPTANGEAAAQRQQLDRAAAYSLAPRRRKPQLSSHRLELAIRETQVETLDFFHEIHHGDLFVSDTITIALVIWLSLFAIFNYLSLSYFSTYLKADLSVYVRLMMEVCIFIQMVFFGLTMLALHRRCLKTYALVCSLMAHDRSRYKRNFLNTVELFTTGKRYFYTILQEYPYSPTVYLSIIGWSVSCFLLIDDLFIRHNT